MKTFRELAEAKKLNVGDMVKIEGHNKWNFKIKEIDGHKIAAQQFDGNSPTSKILHTTVNKIKEYISESIKGVDTLKNDFPDIYKVLEDIDAISTLKDLVFRPKRVEVEISGSLRQDDIQVLAKAKMKVRIENGNRGINIQFDK